MYTIVTHPRALSPTLPRACHSCIRYVIAFGDAAYRSLDAVERLRAEGIDVGLVVKCTLNVVDEEVSV